MDREKMPQAGVRPRTVTVVAWVAILSVVVAIAGLIADRAALGPMLESSDPWERLLLGLGLIGYFLFNRRADAFFGRSYVR